MNRREAVIGLLGLSAAPFGINAQQPAKTSRIGLLFAGTFALRPQFESFYEGLKALGYVEGQNLVIERREAKGRAELFPQLAAELVALKPDLIIAVTAAAMLAVQKATTTIPLVMLSISDPVRLGFAQSLARPGGNITGPSLNMVEPSRKRVQILTELIPTVSRVAVFWNSENPNSAVIATEMERAAAALGLQFESLRYAGPGELQVTLTKGIRATALLVVGDPVSFDQREAVARIALARKLVVFSVWPEEADAGALAAYGPSLRDEYRRGAAYVDKILRGAKPADLPMEEPRKYELIINLKTAKTLGIRVPQSMLLQADRVIE